MTTIYHAQRTNIAGTRPRRADRTIAVIPAGADARSDAAPDAAAELQGILADALTATRADTVQAERDLRIAQTERARAARALEYGLRPMTIDETDRARLRAAYAAADSAVADQQRVVDRARALESAARVIAESADGASDPAAQELADRLTASLALLRPLDAREPRRQRAGSRLRGL